jgi:chaperonin GroES
VYEIQPVGDRVFVRRSEAAKETPGGIVLPDKSQAVARTGTVVAVGPGALRAIPKADGTDRLPMQCKVGDMVVLPSSAEILRLNKEDPTDELVVCQECMLIAILKGE